jgi:biotin carboxyl carrier protein
MKKYLITVNGNEYEVEVEEVCSECSTVETRPQPKAQPKKVEQKPVAQKKKEEVKKDIPQGAETVEAPMPGTILNIQVNEGDTVKAGQVLLILEAMKMENEIVAPRDGKVAAILTTKGASVNTGDKLVSIE